MAAIDIEKEFKHYLEIFTHDEELGKILAKVSFQELFNDKFLTENSKYTSMDDLIWRSGFGIMNLLEVGTNILPGILNVKPGMNSANWP